jgi:hypothetical protein
MTINDLPAIMGTVLIVAGLALVGIYTRFRTEGSEKSVQAGALLIVVGAVLLGLSLFVPPRKIGLRSAPMQIRTLPSFWRALSSPPKSFLFAKRYSRPAISWAGS